jgi:hypothetical protein
MKDQLDIVIPIIKNGSKCNDLELIYCLRSIEKNLTGYRNIVIVGHLPEIINPETVIHIPFKDGANKQANIRNKILAAFEDSRVSETILFANDDHFILRPFTAPNFPYYFYGQLHQAAEKAARISGLYLSEVGNPTKQFDVHAPIVYNKEYFKEAMRYYGEDGSIKSLYCNHWFIEGVEYPDLKINSNLMYHRIQQEIKDRLFFSVGDYGIGNNMKRVLAELFPNQSKYELSNQQIKAA